MVTEIPLKAMKNLERQFSEDLIITQSSKSVTDSIPVDLLIDIFSRVPAKSIARFSCVSKSWESILGRPYFKELFLTKSVDRPRLFFALKVKKDLFVFSSPQPQNPDETSSLVATPYKAAFPKCFPDKISIAYGLVFLYNLGRNLRVICNPVTGDSISLPRVKATSIAKSHFGYDPINKQFKVLCMTKSRYGKYSHRVLTLETGKCLWRRIQDPLLPLYSTRSDGLFINAVGYCHARFATYSMSWSTCCDGIFINGVGYYQAYFTPSSKLVVCFDFRSERFSLINMDKDMVDERYLTLFNYKGHLGAHVQFLHSGLFVLWVLEDAGNHKWSKRTWVMPPLGKQIVKENKFVGMADTGELVFSPSYLSNPFHIFYYNIERNTFTRFNIQGFEEFNHQGIIVHTSLDYVENMKFT